MNQPLIVRVRRTVMTATQREAKEERVLHSVPNNPIDEMRLSL